MKIDRNHLLLPRISLLFVLFAIPAQIAFRPVPAIPAAHLLYSSASAHYYELIDSVGITWEQARVAAEAKTHRGLHGHLATISSAEENAVVFLLGDLDGYYLGGSRDSTDVAYGEPGGGWKWTTGEPWDYTAWLEEETDSDVSRRENYLIGGYDDNWITSDGKSERGYIVEYEARHYRNVCSLLPKDSSARSPVISSPPRIHARTGG
jgi:hypothetical protein